MPHRGLAGLQTTLPSGHLRRRLPPTGGRQCQGRNCHHDSTGGPAGSRPEAPGPAIGTAPGGASGTAHCPGGALDQVPPRGCRLQTPCTETPAPQLGGCLLFYKPHPGWSPCVAPAEVPADGSTCHTSGAVSCRAPWNQRCCPGRAFADWFAARIPALLATPPPAAALPYPESCHHPGWVAAQILELCSESIRIDELEAALSRTKRRSTPGADGITFQMLRNLEEAGRQRLLEFFNDIWSTGDIPESWRAAVVAPILKPRKPATALSS